MMAAFSIDSFNHTSFTVADLDHCCRFFTQVLGFELVSRAPRDGRIVGAINGEGDSPCDIAFLAGYGHVLELIEYRGPADRGRADYRAVDVGAAHIALNVGDINAAVETVRAHGFLPMGEILTIDAGPNKGRRVVYTRSDQGIILEFIQLPA